MRSALLSYARRFMIGLSIISFMLLTASCNNAPPPVVVNKTETPSGKAAPRTTLPMPPTTTTSDSVNAQSFTLMNDQRAKLSDYQGKVVVLDFWATYCPPCRAEAPELDALQKRYSNKGLMVIGLNVGGPDDRPLIPNFTEGLKLKYTMGFPDPEMTYLFMGNDDTIPQTLVFDRRGRMLKHFVGYDQAVSTELERTVLE
ncbi:MAG TPA: TlpA disulfide reductase family protein, partial [Pyrinomonadaceae bacterium]|nr:TlpA disulfide reductase family protein [Pyrinomonadaceae bacterium]